MENHYLQRELFELFKQDRFVFDFAENELLDGLWLWDLEHPENEWISPKFWKILGYDPKEIPNSPIAWRNVINEEDLEIAMENFHKHLKDPSHPYDQYVRYRHKNGSVVWVRCKGMAIRDAEGKPTRMLGIHIDFTSEKRKEEFLTKCNSMAKVGYWEVNTTTFEAYWSQMTKQIHEVDADYLPLVNEAINFFKEGRDRMLIQALVNDAINFGTPYDEQFQLITAKGNLKWVRAIGQTEFVDGKCVRLYGTFQDISDEVLAKQALAAEHNKLANVLKGTNAGTWEWDIVSNQINVNKGWLDIIGIAAQDFSHPNFDSWLQYVHPDDKKLFVEAMNSARSGEEEYFDCEYRMEHKNGDWVWVHSKGKVLTMTDTGQPLLMFGTHLDITEGRRSLELSRLFIEQAPSAIAMVDKNMRYLAASKKWLADYGISDVDVIGKSHYEVFPEIGDDWKAIHQECLAGGENKCDAAPFPRIDGTVQWISWDVRPWYLKEGEIGGLVMNTADITDLKQKEIALSNANSEFEGIFSSETNVSIIATDLAGTITHFSKGAEKMLGYTADELVGKCSPIVIHDKDEVKKRSKELSARYQSTIEGFSTFVFVASIAGFESREWTYIRKDGSRFPVQLVVSPIKDSEGNITRYLGIGTDITEQKQAEIARKNMAMLEAKNQEIEQLTYIASHDLQEPLKTIINFGNLLMRMEADKLSPDGTQALTYMLESTSRMSELITAILSYSKIGQTTQKKEVDCNRLLNEVLADMDALIKEKQALINIEKLPVLFAHPVELKLLFQNLISNALKFQQVGNIPKVDVSFTQNDHAYTFTVSDNGIGIDSKHYHKLFAIFQQLNNRNEYSGIGIGLAHCKKIVELHGGKIWLESEVGKGTKFYFTIYSTNNLLR